MGKALEARRKTCTERLEELSQSLQEAKAKAGNVACVCVTGSFGRGEASEHSDLDPIIIGKTHGEGDEQRQALSRIDEICIKADLIKTARQHGYPEFDGDGAYLAHHTVDDLVTSIGRPEDDVTNRFTSRLLLLLESTPLVGDSVYAEVIGEVVAAYWGDYEDNKNKFLPGFLVNDILRLWRTFCVNYEARTKTEPAEKKAKRKLKNYKLKHSRLLTCYSALAHLLALYQDQGTIHRSDVESMVYRSPTERLEALAQGGNGDVESSVRDVLHCYEQFLEDTDKREQELIDEFMDRKKASAYFQRANELGNAMSTLLADIGQGSTFYRLLVV